MRGVFFVLFLLVSCAAPWNNPYPQNLWNQNAFFSAFVERPKHLDPARAYDEVSLMFVAQIYDAPLQYHYLKRPYTLEPNLLAQMPQIVFLDSEGKVLPSNAKKVYQTRYRLILKENLVFQPHPMFSPNKWNVQNKIKNFKENATRQVVSDDLIYAIYRLVLPEVSSPIASVMEEHIVGLKEFSAKLKKNSGLPWKNAISGIQKIDDKTLDILVWGKYPQFLYWLAMPFFAPIPFEEKAFFRQEKMAENGLTLDSWPVGTGAYMLEENAPESRIVLVKNPFFRKEFYPCEGQESDLQNGLLKDCGNVLPQIEKLVFSREKEALPYWRRFLQGFYDSSGISSDQFDSAVQMDVGRIDLSKNLKEKGILFSESVQSSIFYMGVNMQDSVLGGYSKEKKALRQAINIALNVEEFIAIFLNGRAIAAQSPIPPGIFGFDQKDINPYLYDENGKRKTIEYAKELLKQAGYPNGRHHKTGAPLIVYLDTTSGGLGEKSRLDWLIRQFAQIDIQLVVRSTDFNRFQQKLRQGASQLFYIGWNADYPDPENFLFLLDSKNNVTQNAGDNYTQYHNAQFDLLYQQLRYMDNTEERFHLIQKIKKIVQEDSPWIFAMHPKIYALNHGWLKNKKPASVMNNVLKYQRVDFQQRTSRQNQWNQPLMLPFFILIALFCAVAWAFFIWLKKNKIKQ